MNTKTFTHIIAPALFLLMFLAVACKEKPTPKTALSTGPEHMVSEVVKKHFGSATKSYTFDGGNVVITFAARNNMTAGMERKGIEYAMQDAFAALFARPEVKSVTLHAQRDLTNAIGETRPVVVYSQMMARGGTPETLYVFHEYQ